MPDLSLVLEKAKRADLVGERHDGIDAAQLVQADLVEAEPSQAQLGLLAQVLGTAKGDPLPSQVDVAALGGYHQAWRVRVQRRGQQLLVIAEVIGIGGVNERHAELYRAAGDRDGRR